MSIVSEKSIKAFNTSIFDRVLDSGTTQEKKDLAEQLAALACDLSASDLEREAIVPALMRLAADPVKDVRVLLASILTDCENLHPDVLFSIIADDADIALPFLADSHSLGRLRMLAILKVVIKRASWFWRRGREYAAIAFVILLTNVTVTSVLRCSIIKKLLSDRKIIAVFTFVSAMCLR